MPSTWPSCALRSSCPTASNGKSGAASRRLTSGAYLHSIYVSHLGPFFGTHTAIFRTHSAERRFIKEGDVTLLASKFTPGKPLKKARSEGVCMPVPLGGGGGEDDETHSLHTTHARHVIELHLMLFNDVLLMCTRLHTSSRERRRSVRAALKSDDSMVGGPGGPNGGSSGSSDGDGGSGGGGGTLHRLLASIPGVVSPPSSRRPSLHSHASAASSSLPSSSPSAPLPVTQSTEFTSPPSSPQSYSPLTSPGRTLTPLHHPFSRCS